MKDNINPLQNKFSDNNASVFYEVTKHLCTQQCDHRATFSKHIHDEASRDIPGRLVLQIRVTTVILVLGT
jgi:hypothetical protein